MNWSLLRREPQIRPPPTSPNYGASPARRTNLCSAVPLPSPTNSLLKLSMTNSFPKTDLVRLLALPASVRLLALLAAFRFLAVPDLVRAGIATSDVEAAEAASSILRFQLQRRMTEPSPTQVLALSRAGACELARVMDVDLATVPHSTRSNSSRSVMFLDHTLARNAFALSLAGMKVEADGNPVLLSWEHDRDRLADSVSMVADKGELRRQPLEADGFAVCRGPRGTEGLLVEIDRATEPVGYLGRKYAGYLEWWRQDGHMRRFDVNTVRILTVVTDEKRTARLRDACLQSTQGKAGGLFWFGAEDAMAKHGISAPIWSTARVARLPLWT